MLFRSGTNGVVTYLATLPGTWSWPAPCAAAANGFVTVDGMAESPPVTRLINCSPNRIIEEVKFVNDGDLTIGTAQSKEGNMQYRITTRGTGGTDNAMVMAQSIFSRRY